MTLYSRSIAAVSVRAVPWIERVAEQAGPLTLVAQRFAALAGLSSDTIDSSEETALLHLARTIERYDSADDQALVEGAGALLGLILIAHFNGRHRSRGTQHRCELGPHITFDPFAAIERVIDADNVRQALAHQVQLAETEVRSQGPVSRVITELSHQLESRGIPLRISDVFDHTAWLGPEIEVDLSRVIQATHEGVPVQRAVRRVVESLSGAGQLEVLPWSEARKRILPRIVNATFLSTLPNHGQQLHAESIAPGLHVALTLSYERRARYVRRAEIESWGITTRKAQREAVERLAERSEHTRISRVDTEHGPMVLAKTGDGLDSARVLLPGLFELLSTELGRPYLVALPHRDVLVACAKHPTALVTSVHAHVEREARKAPHAISDQLWWMTAAGALDPYAVD